MAIDSATLWLLGLGFVALFVVMFAIYMMLERDSREAVRRTSEGIVGTLLGVAAVAVMAIAEMLHLLSEIPALAIGALGVGAIVYGFQWHVFAATAAIVYVLLVGIRGSAGARG